MFSTTALSIGALAFSGSRKLNIGAPTVKLTAIPGLPDMNEDTIAKFADWFRSSGVISFCQRRRGPLREYFQPFVELGEETKVRCGQKLDVAITHEKEATMENVRPSSISTFTLNSTTPSTPHSNYVVHKVNLLGSVMLGVCNTGEYYRGVRGRISQSCAFSTKSSLILGGYTSKQKSLNGAGINPTNDDVVYFDSYAVDVGTELNQAQLMQALTLWDVGSMSEVEVAVLARMKLQVEEQVPSFTGGFERLQIDSVLLVVGLTVGLAVPAVMIVILMWDGFARTPERLGANIATLDTVSRIMMVEASKGVERFRTRGPLNRLAIRDITECNCDFSGEHDETCTETRRYHLGSASLGRPTTETVTTIVSKLQKYECIH